MGRFESVGFRAMCGCPAHRDRAATNGRPAQVLPGGWVRSDVATRPIRPFNFDDMVRCYRSIVSFLLRRILALERDIIGGFYHPRDYSDRRGTSFLYNRPQDVGR